MTRRDGGRIRLLVLATLAALGAASMARGQVPDGPGAGFPDPLNDPILGAGNGPLNPLDHPQLGQGNGNPFADANNPTLSPQGDWAEVVTVTNKWLVVQNQRGQQFPVALDKIELFLIRWPVKPEEIPEGTMVEANGAETSTTSMVTEHVDVFAGPSAGLVQAGFASQSTMSAMANNFQIQSNLQFNLFQPIQGVGSAPAMLGAMGWAHVAAPLVGIDPFRVVLQGNAVYTIQTTPNCTFTSVTPGSASVLRKGDIVFFLAAEKTIKSLNLHQLIGYKTIPMNRFAQ